MDTSEACSLLGGLSPATFMRRHWQKKPLLVRQAIPGFRPLLGRSELFALAGREDVESRLVVQQGAAGWKLQRGPLARRALPALKQPRWTLLVQGVDLHDDRAHALLQRFRFVPDARLDDLMISFATDRGGVGPHFDSYDVFLLQAEGRRRWRIGRQRDGRLREGLPVKILANFEPEQEHLLEPGDMLYLPPGWAHDGIAEGECQTYSIGFRVPCRGDLAQELLQRVGDEARETVGDALYRDAGHAATAAPGAIPIELQQFARDAVAAALKDPAALDRALGEYLTEPKPHVWFESSSPPLPLGEGAGSPRSSASWGAGGGGGSLVLDRRTRMMHDAKHVYVNGESWRASGRDATLMRRLADQRALSASDLQGASAGALELLRAWFEAGWLHEGREGDDER